MKQIYGAALVSLLALSGCLDGTNPFMGSDEAADDGGSGGGGGGGNGGGGGDFITGGGTPPGIDGPGATSSSNIVRFEARNDNGGGYAQDFAYDAGSDTFSVTNLAVTSRKVVWLFFEQLRSKFVPVFLRCPLTLPPGSNPV